MTAKYNSFEYVGGKDPIMVDLDPLEISEQKQTERDELSKQVEAFLASGGQINYVEPNVLADPPKKPTSNYGSQPI